MLNPVAIGYDEALLIAVVGLGVNLLSAWILGDDHEHVHHDHDHIGGQHTHAHDHNLRAAHVHVLADAMTSVFAIVALLTARFFGWVWMDPLMGIVGACVIAVWSWGLIRSSAAVLLDTVPDARLAARCASGLSAAATAWPIFTCGASGLGTARSSRPS